MKLFVTFDSCVSSEVLDCQAAPAVTATLVLRHDGGQLGFERFDGPTIMQAFSIVEGVWIVRDDNT